MTRIWIVALLAAGAAQPAAAAMFDKDSDACTQRGDSTVSISECLAAKAKAWDQRLNAAYAALGNRIAPAQRAPLTAAQRAWVLYRDANCRFYAAQDGTIRQIQAAECLRSMTEDRALELDHAMKFD
jgi:uncharacterized protein YecT (DUF1311 family)